MLFQAIHGQLGKHGARLGLNTAAVTCSRGRCQSHRSFPARSLRSQEPAAIQLCRAQLHKEQHPVALEQHTKAEQGDVVTPTSGVAHYEGNGHAPEGRPQPASHSETPKTSKAGTATDQAAAPNFVPKGMGASFEGLPPAAKSASLKTQGNQTDQNSPTRPGPRRQGVRAGRKVPMFSRPSSTQVFASYGAYTGLVGTLAVSTAWACDLDLFSLFHWSTSDLELALMMLVPLQLMNLLIMIPDYSSWSIPPPTAASVSDDALMVASKRQQAESSTGAESAAMHTTSSSDAPPITPAISDATTTQQQVSTEQDTAALASAAFPLPSSTSPTTSTPSPSPSSAASAGPQRVPASQWGKPEQRSLAKVLKDALYLSQSHYVANNPTAGLHLGLESAAVVLNSLATELLYRGVALTLLASWINDRLYEAGADDFTSLRLLDMQLTLTTSDAARWMSVGLLAALVTSLVVRKVTRPRQLRAFVIDLRQLSSKGSAGKKVLDVAPKTTMDAMSLATLVQGIRDLTQSLTLNIVFAATGGNLAASYVAHVTNQLICMALQRYGAERTKKMSALMAKELEKYNEKLQQIIAAKLREKKEGKAAAAAAAATAATVPSSSSTAPVVEGGSQGESLAGTVSAAASVLLDEMGAAAAGSHAAQQAVGGSETAEASAPEAEEVPVAADQMSRTLRALDMLIPEPPKGPGSKSGKMSAK